LERDLFDVNSEDEERELMDERFFLLYAVSVLILGAAMLIYREPGVAHLARWVAATSIPLLLMYIGWVHTTTPMLPKGPRVSDPNDLPPMLPHFLLEFDTPVTPAAPLCLMAAVGLFFSSFAMKPRTAVTQRGAIVRCAKCGQVNLQATCSGCGWTGPRHEERRG
jgi:hypothetical protein